MARYSLSKDGKEIGRVSAVPDSGLGGYTIQDLYVDPEHRRQGHARALLQHVAAQHPGPLSVRPRPFEDMEVGIDPLKAFYASEGFQTRDQRDTMAKTAGVHFGRLAELLYGPGRCRR